MEDLPRFDRPLTSSTEVNIDKVKEMVTENRHFSLRVIAAELSVSHESIRTILNDCRKKIHEFCTTITHHLTRLSL